MKFPELLLGAIQRSEIPLRFEPGAEEAVAKPVTEVLEAWIAAHRPAADYYRLHLAEQLGDAATVEALHRQP